MVPSGVYIRRSNISHTGDKFVIVSGLTNYIWTLNALQRPPLIQYLREEEEKKSMCNIQVKKKHRDFGYEKRNLLI